MRRQPFPAGAAIAPPSDVVLRGRLFALVRLDRDHPQVGVFVLAQLGTIERVGIAFSPGPEFSEHATSVAAREHQAWLSRRRSLFRINLSLRQHHYRPP